MKFLLAMFLFVLITVIFVGSVSADLIGSSDVVIEVIATPILNGILEGFENDSYSKYSKHFTAHLLSVVTASSFVEVDKQIETSFGTCLSKKYLGFLHKGTETVVLWKGRFKNTGSDILIKLFITKEGDDYFVTNLLFQ